jgi:Response regulator receiver domain
LCKAGSIDEYSTRLIWYRSSLNERDFHNPHACSGRRTTARKGIRVWLESERDINIIGEATDGEEAAETIRELKPDLVFVDVRMPGIDGFERK